MNDFLPIKGVDHVEFYVGNAKQAAHFYKSGFGFANTAYSGLETGNRQRVSYVMEQGKIRLVLSTALSPDHPISRHVYLHGDGVAVIALSVPDAAEAYKESTKRGATGAMAPTQEEDEHGLLRYSAIRAYGGDAKWVIDTQPTNFLHIGLHALLVPDARVVVCERDALDTAWACYRRRFADRGLVFVTSPEGIADYLAGMRTLLGHWEAACPRRIPRVRYEELVRRPSELAAWEARRS